MALIFRKQIKTKVQNKVEKSLGYLFRQQQYRRHIQKLFANYFAKILHLRCLTWF